MEWHEIMVVEGLLCNWICDQGTGHRVMANYFTLYSYHCQCPLVNRRISCRDLCQQCAQTLRKHIKNCTLTKQLLVKLFAQLIISIITNCKFVTGFRKSFLLLIMDLVIWFTIQALDYIVVKYLFITRYKCEQRQCYVIQYK